MAEQMSAGIILVERWLLQLEMLMLSHRLTQTQSPAAFAGLLGRMAALQERLLVSSRHSRWPTGFDMAAAILRLPQLGGRSI